MIKVNLVDEVSGAFASYSQKVVRTASRRALTRTLESTRSMLARDMAKETKIKSSALRRGIARKGPYTIGNGVMGELTAKSGESIPLAGYRYRVSYVLRQPKNSSRSMNMRRYQQVSVKFWGKSSFKLIPGAFRARFRANGGNHVAIAIRRSKRRLPLRELFSKLPDLAAPLIRRQRLAAKHAAERFQKEFQTALKYYASKEKGKNPRRRD